jgi:hypothetical protein
MMVAASDVKKSRPRWFITSLLWPNRESGGHIIRALVGDVLFGPKLAMSVVPAAEFGMSRATKGC